MKTSPRWGGAGFVNPEPTTMMRPGSMRETLRRQFFGGERRTPAQPVPGPAQGHRSTSVTTPEQLSAALAGGNFDVIFADAADAPTVERLLAGRPDAPALLPFCDGDERRVDSGCAKGRFCVVNPPKERSMLEAIDQAVDRRDRGAAKATIRS